MFNHESIWRPEAFVTRKITKAVAKILGKKQDKLRLWTLTPIRDWGWAPEFMEGVIKIGDLPEPENMILSTGNGISLQKFVDYCFEIVGLNSADYVELDPDGLNTGVDISVGDSSKARSLIDWNPSFTWKNIAETMVAHDVKLLAER
jgi:GDPmannose 4,6-dehydratase